MCGCAYISDMAFGMPYNRTAKECISHKLLENYDLKVLTDMYQYLTGKKVSFGTAEEAAESLCGLKNTHFSCFAGIKKPQKANCKYFLKTDFRKKPIF